jgi:phenylalanyl-tRNA synthetase beta chain
VKLPLSWLSEFVGFTAEPRQLADDLTLAGLAVDGIERHGQESVLELDITTNRVDCMNVFGVAREVAALYGLPLRAPESAVAAAGADARQSLAVTIEAAELCGRFCARLLDVKMGPSPAWLRDRLELVGIRAINNVVDLTNYVMIELGQPSHAFDLARVAGGALVVRWSREGERLTTLDGQERTLPPRVGVIAAKGGEPALAIAGIMGGASSEIHDGTALVALEAAWWEPLAVRRAARALGMHTEASHRFERGADIAAGPLALERLAHLAAKIGAGSVRPGLVESTSGERPERSVRLRSARVSALLGAEVDAKRQTETLAALGFQVKGKAADATVGVPSWRLDVVGEADLAEEIGRHVGLARIAPALPPSGRIGVLRRSQRQERRIREILTGIGLVEVINYAFVAGSQVVPAPGVRLANPLSVEQDTLRTSLLMPGLVSTLGSNLRLGRRDVAVFELGRVFLPGPERPREERRLAVLLSGAACPSQWSAPARPLDLYDALGVIELLFERLGEPAVERDREAAPPELLHPGRSVRLVQGGRELGWAGALNPELRSRLELRDEAVVVEISTEALLEQPARIARFQPLDRFPAIERDLSVLCDETLPAAEVLERARRAAGSRLRSALLVDRYTGSKLPSGKVSLSVRLRFQADERTLTSEEVQADIDGVVLELRAAGLEIRGE